MNAFDLHRHLEGSHPLEAIVVLAEQLQDRFRTSHLASREAASQACVFHPEALGAGHTDAMIQRMFAEKMATVRDVYVDADSIAWLTRVTCEACAKEAPGGFELRFSLWSMVRAVETHRTPPRRLEDMSEAETLASAEPILRALIAGARQSGTNARLRFGLSRNMGPWANYERVAKLCCAPEFRGDLCGLDLLGFAPNQYPETYSVEMRSLVDQLRADLPDLVIHAGEILNGYPTECPRISIGWALDWQPRALGHGVWAASDPRLLERIAKTGTVLEVCPMSNQLLNPHGMRTLHALAKAHPLLALRQAGVRCIISSDDPAIQGTSLADDRGLVQNLGLELEDFDTTARQRWDEIPKPSWTSSGSHLSG